MFGNSPRGYRFVGTLLLISIAPLTAVSAGTMRPAEEYGPAAEQNTPLQRGIAALREGDLRTATAALERAVEFDPNGVEPHYWLGIARLEGGDPQGAAESLRRAEDLIGRFEPRIAYQLGVALMRSRDLDEARTRFEALAEDDPRAALPRLNLGWILMQEDQGGTALELFEAVVADHPDNADAYYYGGLVHDGNARFEQARGAYRQALQLSPDFLQALLALGKLEMASGELTEARELFQRAAARHPQVADAHLQLGLLELREGDLGASIRELERALTLDAGNQPARYNLGLTYARAGRADEADAALARFDESRAAAVEIERAGRRGQAESRAESLARKAQEHIAAGRFPAAIEALEEAATLRPADVHAWELLVEAYRGAGDTDGLRRAQAELRILRGGGP